MPDSIGAEDFHQTKSSGHNIDHHHLQSLDWSKSLYNLALESSNPLFHEAYLSIAMESDQLDEYLNHFDPLAFAARASDPDTPKWNGTIHGPNADAFWNAMYS